MKPGLQKPHWMEVFSGAKAFDGLDPGVVLDALHLFGAGARHLAIEQKGAGAALAGPASDLGACQAKTADDIGQGVLVGIAEHFAFYPVDDEKCAFDRHGMSSSARFISACGSAHTGIRWLHCGRCEAHGRIPGATHDMVYGKRMRCPGPRRSTAAGPHSWEGAGKSRSCCSSCALLRSIIEGESASSQTKEGTRFSG